MSSTALYVVVGVVAFVVGTCLGAWVVRRRRHQVHRDVGRYLYDAAVALDLIEEVKAVLDKAGEFATREAEAD